MKPETVIRELEREISALNVRRAEVDKTIQGLIQTIEHYRSKDTNGIVQTAEKTRLLPDTMRDILSNSPGPLHRERIRDLLIQRGFDIPGKDSMGYIGNLLSRDPRFIKVKGERGNWDLKEYQNGETPQGTSVVNLDRDTVVDSI